MQEIETCPSCGYENILQWDVKKNGYEAKCQHCGKSLMLCDACLNADDNETQFCNWSKKNGCWRRQKTEG